MKEKCKIVCESLLFLFYSFVSIAWVFLPFGLCTIHTLFVCLCVCALSLQQEHLYHYFFLVIQSYQNQLSTIKIIFIQSALPCV
jgi:hypothetical protein